MKELLPLLLTLAGAQPRPRVMLPPPGPITADALRAHLARGAACFPEVAAGEITWTVHDDGSGVPMHCAADESGRFLAAAAVQDGQVQCLITGGSGTREEALMLYLACCPPVLAALASLCGADAAALADCCTHECCQLLLHCLQGGQPDAGRCFGSLPARFLIGVDEQDAGTWHALLHIALA